MKILLSIIMTFAFLNLAQAHGHKDMAEMGASKKGEMKHKAHGKADMAKENAADAKAKGQEKAADAQSKAKAKMKKGEAKGKHEAKKMKGKMLGH